MSECPNILVLMTDQQRADAMGCAGDPILRTPAMDAIAASGVRFTDACASTPVCVASRMSFITGHRAARTHWVDNSALPGPVPELPTMMSLLLRAGYWTHGVGKMHFRGRSYGFRNLLTMEEGVAHRVDDDYLRYLRDAGVEARFPKGFRDLLYFQPQTSGVPVEHSASNWVADRSIEFLREHARYRSEPAVLPVVLLDRAASAVRAQRAVRHAVRSGRHAVAGVPRPPGTATFPRPSGRTAPASTAPTAIPTACAASAPSTTG